MTINDGKSYLPHLKKLVDEYNNTYYDSINKKFCFDWKKETNPKAPNSKFNGRAWVTTYKTFLVKVTLDISPGKFLLLILFSKLIVGHII